MRNRGRAALTVLACAVVATGIGWLLLRSDDPAHGAATPDVRGPRGRGSEPIELEPAELPRATVHGSAAEDAPQDAPQPEVRFPQSLPSGVIEADGPPGCPHEHGEMRTTLPDEHFDEAYASHTLQDLVIAKALVEQENVDHRQRLFAERFEAGLCDTYVFERRADLEVEDTQRHRDGGLLHCVTSQTLEDGRVLSRLTFLPYEEYPAVYEQLDELFYLIRRISKERSAPVGR